MNVVGKIQSDLPNTTYLEGFSENRYQIRDQRIFYVGYHVSEAQKGRAINYVNDDNGERLHNVVEPFPQRNYRLPNDITIIYLLQKRNI